MNERKIQNSLWASMSSQYDVLLSNFTPRGWFECDLFGVSRRGYFHEFEIKLTVADFRKDAKKFSRAWEDNPNYDPLTPWTPENNNPHQLERRTLKHDRLTARDVKGPSRFWFIMPVDMVPLTDVPDWAGVRWLKIRDHHCWATIARPAPKLHGEITDRAVTVDALTACYHRYWRVRLKLAKVLADMPAVATADDAFDD